MAPLIMERSENIRNGCVVLAVKGECCGAEGGSGGFLQHYNPPLPVLNGSGQKVKT